jgi:hypothetical protein
MREVKSTSAGSLLVGRMPKGCRLCIKGAKLVLFITGICEKGCWYCPISNQRRGKDVVYANERVVRSPQDVIEEAKSIDALGTGITGGDPFFRFRRVLKYLKLLKRKFGEEHHIHLYTGSKFSLQQLKALKGAGLDELRFHTWSPEPVKLALKAGLDAGVEIPAIPGKLKQTKQLLTELDQAGCNFVNLNELEFSETNLRALKTRGFKIKSDTSMGVKGSEEIAKDLLEWAAEHTGLNVHYCPSALKDRVQLRNRLKRKARNVAKPHEWITSDGLLVKGVIYGCKTKELRQVRKWLISKYRIPPKLLYIDRGKHRMELSLKVAEKLAKLEPALKFALVEEYPTVDRLETTFIPLRASSA